MSLAAKGAYVDLLGHQFETGRLPTDNLQVCRIIGALPEEWEAIKSEVLTKFEDQGDGTMVNLRMEDERNEREANRLRSIENGKKGGRPPSKENPGVNLDGTQKEPNPEASTTTTASYSKYPTLAQAREVAPTLGLTPDQGELYWHTREASDWMKSTASGGTTPVGKNWQSDMKVTAPKLQINGQQTGHRRNGARPSRNDGTAMQAGGAEPTPGVPRPPGV